MKTLLGSLLALGLLSTAASAQYCAPGYGHGHRTFHKPTVAKVAEPEKPAEVAPAPVPADPAPAPVPPK